MMKDNARKAMAAKLVADEIKARGDAAKAALLDEMSAAGAERIRVADEDGTDLGSVSLGAGRASAAVVDEEKFTAWVRANYPEAIVETVDYDWKNRLLKLMKDAGDAVDPNTGEVVPGAIVAQGAPYISARPTAEARDRMRGLLNGSGLLELAGGDTDAQ